MANWAMTDYVIEGPHEILEKINNAILHHDVQEGSSDNWEGNVLKALGLEWEDYKVDLKKDTVKFSGYYMRGFIEDKPSLGENTLEFYAQEAWGVTNFKDVLEKAFPDIKVFYKVEEEGQEIFATNDTEGKYFPDRFYVDMALNDEYASEYFKAEKDMWKWIKEITNGLVAGSVSMDSFNELHEEEGDDDANFIHIHEFSVID